MIMTLLYQFTIVFVAIGAFSMLFSVSPREYVFCGLTGATGFVCYSAALMIGLSQPLASLCGAVVLTLLTRILSAVRCCPSTIFLTAGIFPLVPGLDIYRAAYYVIIGDNELFFYHGMLALKIAVAIAIGIIVVFALPNQLFGLFHKKTKSSAKE